MAWNKPGDDNRSNDPWGSGQKNQGPPDIDKMLAEFFNKLRNLLKFNGKKSDWQPSFPKEFGVGVGGIVLVVFALWFLSGLFIVNPAEQAVVLRFGQYSESLDPGLHWMARFIDTKYLVDVQKINSFSLEGDYLTKSSDQSDSPSQYITVDTKKLGVAESADKSKNLVNVQLTVQYRIGDPRAYLFNVVNPDHTIQEVASGALSDVVGMMKLDDVLTTGRELLSSRVLERTKQVLAGYNAGLDVVAVTLRKVQAPDQVQEAFNDVNRAEQDRATYIQQAQAYASKVVPFAQGVAARTLADANAYRQQSVLLAQGQVARYQALLSVYKGSPDLMRERMYLEAMQTIMQHTSKILLDSNTGNNVFYLPVDKLMQTMKSNDVTDNAKKEASVTFDQANDSLASQTAIPAQGQNDGAN